MYVFLLSEIAKYLRSSFDLRLRTLNSKQTEGVYNCLLLTAEVQQMKYFRCVCFK